MHYRLYIKMSRLCLLVFLAFMNSFAATQILRNVTPSYIQSKIVPDVLPVAPAGYMSVLYPNGARVREGNLLTPTQVQDVPWVTWDGSLGIMYTVVMIDPDAPSRENPTNREWLHWLVVNVRGVHIESGETLAEYVGAGPPQDSGLHRYVFLVYEQPYQRHFDEPRLTNRSGAHRKQFSVAKFAKKYNMGDPIAGNFFQAEYDDYVPILYQQLTGGQTSTLRSNITMFISVMMLILTAIM